MNTIIDLASVKRSCRSCHHAHLCLAKGLDNEELSRFDSAVRHGRIIQRGGCLYRQGDTITSLYLVSSGTIKLSVLSADGDEQVLGFYWPGDMLGLDALESGYHGCTATVLETSSVCTLLLAQFDDMSRQLSGIRRQMDHVYGRQMSRDRFLLQTLVCKDAEQRLARFLLDLAQRFATRGLAADEFQLSMSRHDIASYLGLAVETVSRLFARLQEDQLLIVERRHIRLLDLTRLQQLAGIQPLFRDRQRCG
jgi:CRP/FNR family transcriptional regulator